VVLYGCETWSLTLREEHGLRVFENRVLRIFGQKRDEVDKTDCSNYCGISLLSTSYKILSSILSKLSPYIDEIIGDHQCGFLHIRSIAFVRYWRKNGSTMRQYISYS
jgi:hypothetical protein